jgi:hypothetical protein
VIGSRTGGDSEVFVQGHEPIPARPDRSDDPGKGVGIKGRVVVGICADVHADGSIGWPVVDAAKTALARLGAAPRVFRSEDLSLFPYRRDKSTVFRGRLHSARSHCRAGPLTAVAIPGRMP